MNYLAHLLLADDTPPSLVGNLIADFIKGPQFQTLSAEVQQGIRLHRQVDGFTDRHPVVQRSIQRVSARWGWFSGILIDMWYDHLLSQEWERFSPVPLRAFVDRVHIVLRDQMVGLPEEVCYGLTRLIEVDRLANYGHIAGITDSLVHLSKRIMQRMPERAVQLQDAVPDLGANQTELLSDFLEFFPQLIAFTMEWKRSQAHSPQ